MTSILPSTLRAGALTLALTLPALAAIPIADFFQHPTFIDPQLSPDATALAVITNSGDGRDRLAVIDLATRSAKVVAQFSDADIGTFEWVNPHRLVFNSADRKVGPADLRHAPGLFAVNRDGTGQRQLVAVNSAPPPGLAGRRILPYNHYFSGLKTAQDSDAIYVYRYELGTDYFGDTATLVRLDTVTGAASTVPAPGVTSQWLLDHAGEPRLAVTRDKNISAIQYRDPITSAWRQLAAFDGYLGGAGAFRPVAFAPDGALYVTSSAGGDLQALYRFDLTANKLGAEPLVSLEGFDFSGALIAGQDKLLGVTYLSDARGTTWFDDKLKAAQAAVDALLPGTVNLISTARRPALPLVLVTAYSDVQPMRYYLFNTASGRLENVGQSQPAIKPAEMATQEIVRIKTRDGLVMPAWLTIPKGAPRKGLPLVVLVHGGPHVRGVEWGWDDETQFLASRGYAVLAPEFRGSKGYGSKLFRAGWRQWGLAMQDDVADATRWAIAQGIVDPERICIAGASYGGYATLMGLINDPGLYKCGVNWAGVTDIKLLYSGHWSADSDLGDDYKKYGMPTLVGDPVRDAAQLTATSPLAQAGRIRQPLLLAYGADDRRVPLYHGRLFHKAVKQHNGQVEMVVYNEEGHGWKLPKNKIDFWGRVEQFLDKHIGKK